MAAIPGKHFASNHPADRNFFLLYVVFIWIGVSMGFGPQIVRHLETHAPPYPLIVHFHAAAFVGWLVLLSVQVLLIRAHRLDLHRKLGTAGAVLALVMLVLGPLTAIIVDRAQLGTPRSDPPFLSVQFCDMLAFAGFVISALLLRRQPAAHKRLMLLAILYISDAGFARWLAHDVSAMLGEGFWPMMASLYLGNDVLIAGMGAYDLVTRRRLHPAYLAGIAWVLANQLLAVTLYFSPGWNTLALRILTP